MLSLLALCSINSESMHPLASSLNQKKNQQKAKPVGWGQKRKASFVEVSVKSIGKESSSCTKRLCKCILITIPPKYEGYFVLWDFHSAFCLCGKDWILPVVIVICQDGGFRILKGKILGRPQESPHTLLCQDVRTESNSLICPCSIISK